MRISLKEEMETLLIPLYSRAEMSRKGIFPDKEAELALEKIDYDFSRLRIQGKTQVMLSLRSALMDAFANDFLHTHPDSTVIHLGCGLDARGRRLRFPAKLWYDLDFPEVIAVKKKLYEETERYRYIPSSVTDWKWLDALRSVEPPVLIIAEGLLMYLDEQEIKNLFLKMRDQFQDAVMIFDVYSNLTAKHAKQHPSLKKTGATIRSGIDSPQEIEAFGDGISHLKTIYLTGDTVTKTLPPKYRLMFQLAGKFKSAQEAHRIFVMKLLSLPTQAIHFGPAPSSPDQRT